METDAHHFTFAIPHAFFDLFTRHVFQVPREEVFYF